MKRLIAKIKFTRFWLIRKLAKDYPIMMNMDVDLNRTEYIIGWGKADNGTIKPQFRNDDGYIYNCKFTGLK